MEEVVQPNQYVTQFWKMGLMAQSAGFELCIYACWAKLFLQFGLGFMFVRASHQEL